METGPSQQVIATAHRADVLEELLEEPMGKHLKTVVAI